MSTEEKAADGSGAMFDRIAARYDTLNRCLSLGLDRGWRRRLIGALGVRQWTKEGLFLDVATGTADVAILAARWAPGVRVYGIDPSEKMVELGREKVLHAGLTRVQLEYGSAEDLPYPDDLFGAVACAFGLRNMRDRRLGLQEMVRVCQPGGRVGILEFHPPERWPWRYMVQLYLGWVPLLAGLWSEQLAYRYLQTSIAAFPAPRTVCAWLRDAGLIRVRSEYLGFGTVSLYVGEKPHCEE
jgi:demethylmenaquinone methyltransferase/2-methoxy-6-polyprenyl-1,4-benzoquinol methylase